MIYTVGNREIYQRHWKESGGALQKLGRCEDYCGGSVWQTYAEAERVAARNPGFAVFGVDADWKCDTTPNEDSRSSFHDLLRDADIIMLEPVL